MAEIDKRLRTVLIEQSKKNNPITDKQISGLKNKRYTSGRLIRHGDIVMLAIEQKSQNPSETTIHFMPKHIKFPGTNISPTAMLVSNKEFGDGFSILNLIATLITFSSNDINDICKNYWYAGGADSMPYIIRRPE